MWSQVIRLRDNNMCQICHIPGNNAHHIIGRRNHNTRWDIDNGILLCAGCHTLRTNSAHQNPLWFMDWLIEKKGGKFVKDLRIRGSIIYKPDYQSIKLFLNNELNQYKL